MERPLALRIANQKRVSLGPHLESESDRSDAMIDTTTTVRPLSTVLMNNLRISVLALQAFCHEQSLLHLSIQNPEMLLLFVSLCLFLARRKQADDRRVDDFWRRKKKGEQKTEVEKRERELELELENFILQGLSFRFS